MVRCVVAALEESKTAVLGAAFENKGHPAVGGDAGLVAGVGEKKIIIADSAGCARNCRAMIDFTSAGATLANLKFCSENGINMVIGTTGFSPEQKKEIASAAKKIAVVMAPNMGVGVNVLLKLIRQVSAMLGEAYDIEVIEAHHNLKKDAPSGTALAMAEAAASGRNLDLRRAAVHGRQGNTGARPKGEIGIHAVRGGDIIGEHTVLFAGPGEKIEITHSVVTRDVFAKGAVRAAEFLLEKEKGLFSMQDVLGL